MLLTLRCLVAGGTHRPGHFFSSSIPERKGTNLQREPATIVGVITAIATAFIALYVAFGGERALTNDQQVALLGVVAAVAPLVAGIIIRNKVVSPDTAERIVASAHRTPPQRSLPTDVYDSIPNVSAPPDPPTGL